MVYKNAGVFSHSGGLTLHVLQNFQVQILNNLPLRLAHPYVVVKAGCGVDFQNPVGRGLCADVAVNLTGVRLQSNLHKKKGPLVKGL